MSGKTRAQLRKELALKADIVEEQKKAVLELQMRVRVRDGDVLQLREANSRLINAFNDLKVETDMWHEKARYLCAEIAKLVLENSARESLEEKRGNPDKEKHDTH